MNRRVVLGLVVILLVASIPAFADNAMAGRWKGSGGWVFTIPDSSGSFDLVVVGFRGERVVHKAQWISVGHEFSWIDKQNSKHTATLDTTYKKLRIRDVNPAYPNSPGYWYKL
jgi:hypothetical protein